MADRRRGVVENVPGDFFVDETCIDCDACRQLAPEVFADAGEYSFVHAQPQTGDAGRKALQALLACPTGSIGRRTPTVPAKREPIFRCRLSGCVLLRLQLPEIVWRQQLLRGTARG
jgi:ferredoxin